MHKTFCMNNVLTIQIFKPTHKIQVNVTTSILFLHGTKVHFALRGILEGVNEKNL